MTISIDTLDPKERMAYEDFLLKNPHNQVYPTLEFRDFLQSILSGEPVYLIAKRDSEIVGVLPYFRAKDDVFGTVINSLPWYGSHGGCVLADERDLEIRRELLKKFVDIANQKVLSATVIVSPFENKWYNEYASQLAVLHTDSRIGQITELPDDGPEMEERLLMTCRQKTRNLVRKALKQGFRLRISDEIADWRFLYQVHEENMVAMGGKAKPWDHFASIRKHIPTEQRKLLIAQLDESPVAALLLLAFNRTVEYLTPVIKQEYRSSQPLSFLIWHGMVEAVKEGYRWWNWGGTWVDQKSLHHFKAGWGAADMPYTYFVLAGEKAVETIRKNREAVAKAFPFYYIFPFHLL